jgi:iron complex outermembrane receptor protein
LPDSTSNLARVAPSSRPHAETFTRSEIEDLKPTDVYDLLWHATGVMTTYQGRKLSYNLQIRGDSNYGIIIDNAYVPLATAGRILQTLPVAAIEQVDIIKDPTALTLGPLVNLDSASGALNSGFVVIRTHRPEKTEGQARTRVENFGTFAGYGYAGTAFIGDLTQPSAFVSAMTSYKRSDGPSGYNAWNNTETALLKAGVSAGVLQSEVMLFQDHARYGFERAKAGESTAALVAQQWSYSPIDTVLATSNTVFTWNAMHSTLLTFSFNTVSANNIQGSYTSSAVSTNYDRTYTFNTNLRHNIRFEDTLVQLGGQYMRNNSLTGQLFYAGYAHAEETTSGYANIEQKFFGDRLLLDVSARLDSHKIDQGIDLYNQGNGSGNGRAVYQYFYNRQLPLAKNYAAGGVFKVLPQLLATARYSHTEQGGLSNILSADGSQINPESQNKWEVGLEAPIATYLKAGANYFDTSVANDKTPTSYRTVNGYQTPLWSQSDTRRAGFELLASGNLLNNDWIGQTSYRAS